nr:MAG TPA: hypothetical protein [Bacteriophage sp.]
MFSHSSYNTCTAHLSIVLCKKFTIETFTIFTYT